VAIAASKNPAFSQQFQLISIETSDYIKC